MLLFDFICVWFMTCKVCGMVCDVILFMFFLHMVCVFWFYYGFSSCTVRFLL